MEAGVDGAKKRVDCYFLFYKSAFASVHYYLNLSKVYSLLKLSFFMASSQYITDNKGNKLSVELSSKDYQKMMEELEDIRLYDDAKSGKEQSIPIDEAFKLIEAKRKKRYASLQSPVIIIIQKPVGKGYILLILFVVSLKNQFWHAVLEVD